MLVERNASCYSSGMMSEQWKSSLFAGLALVLVGLCYAVLAQSAPLLSIPLQRKYTSQTIDWPSSDCRVAVVRFKAAAASLAISNVKLTFTNGRTQLLNRFSALLFKDTATDWFRVDRSLRDDSLLCIDRIEVTARSTSRIWPHALLQVEVK